MSTLLEVQNLSKYFSTPKGELHAVENVSFKLNAGETLGVVGESGCGKSTLGRTIIHLTESTAGTILFDGEDITHPKNKGELKSLRRQMQMIFQDPFASLNPRMTVEEIIAEPLFIYKVGSKQEIYAKIKKLMDTVGISERIANAYPHELDGGRRQRVGIARALALEPKLIVCDEPVSALDVSIQAQILNLMQGHGSFAGFEKETGADLYFYYTRYVSCKAYFRSYSRYVYGMRGGICTQRHLVCKALPSIYKCSAFCSSGAGHSCGSGRSSSYWGGNISS